MEGPFDIFSSLNHDYLLSSSYDSFGHDMSGSSSNTDDYHS